MNLYHTLYDIIVKSPIVQLILILILFRFIVYLFKVIFFRKKNIIINNIDNQILEDRKPNLGTSINKGTIQKKIYDNSSYYYKRTKFFSENESIFFKNLYKILNIIDYHRYIIFSKVRVSDIIGSRSEKNWSKNRAWLKINPWHFDFVICDIKNEYEPVAVVELDDNSHNNHDVEHRDNIKNTICRKIHLPMIRTYGHESLEKVKQELIDVL